MEKKGFWKQRFEFSNIEGGVVVVLTPLSNWKNWRNDLSCTSIRLGRSMISSFS